MCKLTWQVPLNLSSPITEDEWDAITDVDFDYTNEITFHTKHGKKVVFVKKKVGRWTYKAACSICGCQPWYECDIHTLHYCPHCGADMRG